MYRLEIYNTDGSGSGKFVSVLNLLGAKLNTDALTGKIFAESGTFTVSAEAVAAAVSAGSLPEFNMYYPNGTLIGKVYFNVSPFTTGFLGYKEIPTSTTIVEVQCAAGKTYCLKSELETALTIAGHLPATDLPVEE